MVTKAEALGRWLQLNDEVKKRLTASTWRLAGSGDVLGWTLAVDGNAVVVGQVNARNSGASYAPIPAEPPRVSLNEVRSWALAEAMGRIEDEDVTVRDLNYLYRTSGGNPRITWTAYRNVDEMPGEDEGELVTGIYVVSANAFGLVPLEAVLSGKKTIIVPRADVVPLQEPGKGRPGAGLLQQDGLPEMTTGERIAWQMTRHDNT